MRYCFRPKPRTDFIFLRSSAIELYGWSKWRPYCSKHVKPVQFICLKQHLLYENIILLSRHSPFYENNYVPFFFLSQKNLVDVYTRHLWGLTKILNTNDSHTRTWLWETRRSNDCFDFKLGPQDNIFLWRDECARVGTTAVLCKNILSRIVARTIFWWCRSEQASLSSRSNLRDAALCPPWAMHFTGKGGSTTKLG